jgi:formamidopyrimidine-DNA glycosylase
MPELPEVEVITRELRPQLVGEKIRDLKKIWHKTIVESEYSPLNKRIQTISRHGKYIIIHLADGAILIHLRMTGQIIIKDQADVHAKHLRAYIKFESGKILHFFDSRKFGRIYVTSNPQYVLKNTGIDALDLSFEVGAFINILNKKKGQIKSVLLDQKNIAGLGNIYIDECLFASRIHPLTPANRLNDDQTNVLFNEIHKILVNAIDRMGTTISDYKTVGGGFGSFQNYLKVYGRTDQPCLVCNSPISKIRINNRGTHFCANCQVKLSNNEI